MKLLFNDGKIIEGTSFGYEKNVAGEVVFNTAMTGYPESLTDPSYRGQILVLTYPLQGNYGIPDGLIESKQIQIQGLIVSHLTQHPSHWRKMKTLSNWLRSQGIPGMCNVDTRSLTQYLREHGTVWGTLMSNNSDDEDIFIDSVDESLLLNLVSVRTPIVYGESPTKILLIGTGVKENIIRCLVTRGVSIIRAPWDSQWEAYLPEVDGVFLGNGPGDPDNAHGLGDPILGHGLIERIANLLNMNIPIFGICFGNQLLALAAGLKTEKMKYGHRSVNQPVRDLKTGKCYITSQNHGYVVQNHSFPEDWELWFVNINDGTTEGIRHKHKPIFSVQFHPEASPGPHDTFFLFDDFIKLVNSQKIIKPTPLIDKIAKRIPEVPEKN